MNKKDKNEFTMIVTDALNDVMIPALESLETRLTDKLASKEDMEDIKMKVDSLDRKFDAQQNRLDRHGKQLEDYGERIQVLETTSL
ncbi:hypothetical protein COX03_03195 [Candidatus Woesebacteria bacterium CG22_combo_CG10-13_8_21_14_all_39_10]|uniref:Uncharacterized protein n=4 Tax=Candidatus Woeseibacteriota TaxID=1752722 RepID=A0A2M7X9F7_9BACT|nr:MAG: hypothetical protein COX03_03195 [Candidatus Woesebacteria bacterium CG22_combo_CG10-13_8_21_14_all_39_10]PIU71990.1 MAG: hypothetical protein COS80_00205 [Candidatus Woesebacteria bacterium CG06_land_8_20_14_3_00_39_27]PIZ48751.1 MAG: hypothetical protein COY29_03090 [Candidatus Woesebacteria bacterium CG_4_10_14_0_2_um_filter_39_14]PJA42792.1 MAG: hypothetical protein CO176_01455 [Candidatus Woesebacteria bacterium CG_4_9_14_3_um_filter_39_10]